MASMEDACDAFITGLAKGFDYNSNCLSGGAR
jgi:hypothetical protein